ncbi:MAG: radical SAM protein, partial [Erysipelotrichaceae bacterium]|nr:radical SAM protein [Erysipelotrichaceae bacterium]
MIKTYRHFGLIVLFNTENGKTAFFHDNVKTIKTKEIPGFHQPINCKTTESDYKTFYLGFNISNKCNLNCKYCFRSNKTTFIPTVSYIKEKVTAFLNAHPGVKKLFLDLSGDGEPLLKLDLIKEIATLCQELKVVYQIDIIPMLISNGVLLTPQIVKFLQVNLVLFGVSFDGTKAYHDLMRNHTYDIVSQNLLAIKENDYVGVSMTLSPLFNDDIVSCYLNMLKHAPTVAIRFQRSINQDDYSFHRIATRVKQGYFELVDLLIAQVKEDNYQLLFSILNGDDYFGKLLIRLLTNTPVDGPCEGHLARFSYLEDQVYPCAAASEEGL